MGELIAVALGARIISSATTDLPPCFCNCGDPPDQMISFCVLVQYGTWGHFTARPNMPPRTRVIYLYYKVRSLLPLADIQKQCVFVFQGMLYVRKIQYKPSLSVSCNCFFSLMDVPVNFSGKLDQKQEAKCFI